MVIIIVIDHVWKSNTAAVVRPNESICPLISLAEKLRAVTHSKHAVGLPYLFCTYSRRKCCDVRPEIMIITIHLVDFVPADANIDLALL